MQDQTALKNSGMLEQKNKQVDWSHWTDLPRNGEPLIDCFRGEEPINILLKCLLELVLKNDIFPVCLLDFQPKFMTFLPKLVEHPNFVVKLALPYTCSKEERASWILRAFKVLSTRFSI